MDTHMKAIALENCINKFAGGDWNIISADSIVLNFKKQIASGLSGLQCRDLISKIEEIELFNTIKNCNNNFKKALTKDYDIECIDAFVKKIKTLSQKKNKELERDET